MRSLEKILKNKEHLIFIDFEGTQFSHEIIASGVLKVKIEDGKLIRQDNGLLNYSKSRCPVGKIVTSITGISDDFIKQNGKSFVETIDEINTYLGDIDLDKTLFICFGSNDPKMLVESIRYSNPSNKDIAQSWLNHFFDFLTFISQFIKDDKGNNYSLVNYLRVFNIEPNGTSHNPLNDAIDLFNLFQAFTCNKDIVFSEYLKTLRLAKFPNEAVKNVVIKLLDGNEVSKEEFLLQLKESIK